MSSAGGAGRWRRSLAVVMLALAGLLLPVGLLAGWANTTFYDSDTFSQRAVDLLHSPAVVRVLADKLTEQLAVSGNQEAVNFRPAFQLAIEAAIDTDTFRSIFRTAVRRAHQGVLAGRKGATLDLSDSVSIIAGTLKLPTNARPAQKDQRALGSSLGDVTRRMARLRVWQLDDITAGVSGIGTLGGLVAAGSAVALAGDRRRMLRLVGWVVVGDGLALAALVLGVRWYAGSVVGDAQLAAAVRGAVQRGMADLTSIGLWTAGYGVVIAAAARSRGARRLTPAAVRAAVTAWVERRRRTTGGTVALGAAAVALGVVLVSSPAFWLKVSVLGTGLWLAYFGVAELIGLAQAVVPATPGAEGRRHHRRRLAIVAGATALSLLVVSAGLVLTTRGAARRANAAGEPRCNGDAALCDVPLNLAVFPATHNSMSSALYRNWLFAEHVKTISGQLNSGVRALLYDTHYGVPSAARFPGSDQPVIVTDRAAELRRPTGESAKIDSTVAERADQLAKQAPRAANANRGIYLCHVYCELGAIPFSDGLKEVKTFLDSHPDDVVMTVIEDATTPRDTADEIVKAGLGEDAYTLDPNKPLPTLGEIIKSKRRLLVFAEGGGEGAPAWYHKAYEGWFQETPYTWDEPAQMNCEPNRGTPDAPMFLLNHWLSADPPSPNRTAGVNKREFLERRVRRCLAERGQLPNVIAVDFSERGDLIATVRSLNHELAGQVRQARRPGRPSPTPAPGGSVPPTEPPTSIAGGPPPDVIVRPPTRITSLTGGDPGTFCARVPAMLDAVGSWALADAATPASARGLSELAYAPAAARVIDALDGVTPEELAQRLGPAKERAHAAVAALAGLGLDGATIDGQAQLVQDQLASNDDPDPVAVQTVALDQLRAKVGNERLEAARRAFDASYPAPPSLFDLGSVPDDVARGAGYECLVGTGA